MRILLVEDERRAAQVLANGLREQAYAVDLARNGREALYQASLTDYDAVVLDVMMPRLDRIGSRHRRRLSSALTPWKHLREFSQPLDERMMTAGQGRRQNGMMSSGDEHFGHRRFSSRG